MLRNVYRRCVLISGNFLVNQNRRLSLVIDTHRTHLCFILSDSLGPQALCLLHDPLLKKVHVQPMIALLDYACIHAPK